MAWLMKHLALISRWVCPGKAPVGDLRIGVEAGCLFFKLDSCSPAVFLNQRHSLSLETLSPDSPSWAMITSTPAWSIGSGVHLLWSWCYLYELSHLLTVSLSTVSLLDSLQIISRIFHLFAAGTLTDKCGRVKFSLLQKNHLSRPL